VFEADTPVKKLHLDKFKQKGFSAPPHFIKAGLFYVHKKGITATASFGQKRIQVQASGKNAEALLNEFEKILDELTRKL